MNMMVALTAPDPTLGRAETAGLVALASRTVPPLWPLEHAIAVNPLAGFEDRPFAEAVRLAAERFGARETLPLGVWRQLFHAGHIDEQALNDAAIQQLGGAYQACTPIVPAVKSLDLLMARLLDLPAADTPAQPAALAGDAAFVAKWCAAFFDQGLAASPMPNRELGLYRAVLAIAGHDPEFARLTGEVGRQLLLTVPREPLDAIAEALAALEVAEGAELDHLARLVARLPGWAGHIRWRCEHADPAAAAGAPATMADLLALWLLLERAGVTQSPVPRAEGRDITAEIARRRTLPFQVVDHLIRLKDGAVLTALAENSPLGLNRGQLDTLVASARTITALRRPLSRHDGLTESQAFSLYAWCDSELRQDLAQRFHLKTRTLDAALSASDPADVADDNAIGAQIAKLHRGDQLTSGYLVRALLDNHLSAFVQGLAQLGELPLPRLRAAMEAASAEPLALACRAAGMDRIIFPQVLAAVRRLNHGRPAGSPDDGHRVDQAFGGVSPRWAGRAFRLLDQNQI